MVSNYPGECKDDSLFAFTHAAKSRQPLSVVSNVILVIGFFAAFIQRLNIVLQQYGKPQIGSEHKQAAAVKAQTGSEFSNGLAIFSRRVC